MPRPHALPLLAVGALLLSLSGCAEPNSQAPALSDAGRHPAGWVVDHRRAFQQQGTQCLTCHGSDLRGGVARVDCFNQGGLATCHAGGHGPRSAPHAVPFTDPSLHGAAAKQDLVFCQLCHGTPGAAGSNPRFNVSIGSLTSGCEAAGCHNLAHPAAPATGSAHPIPWRGHRAAANLLNACALCHGADFGGTASGGVGPACRSCHTLLAAGTVPLAGSCSSCHSTPPATGSHAAHLAIGGMGCSACHQGGGSGGANHGNGSVTVAFGTAYNAKSGSALLAGNRSCTNVGCHGGIVTPVWGIGTIDVATACLACHTDGTATPSAPPQFNSFRSGRHATHLFEIGLACTDCHDMSVTVAGNSHFSGLGTTGFELAPGSTMRSYLHFDPAGPSCAPQAVAPAGNTVGVCHADRKHW